MSHLRPLYKYEYEILPALPKKDIYDLSTISDNEDDFQEDDSNEWIPYNDSFDEFLENEDETADDETEFLSGLYDEVGLSDSEVQTLGDDNW